MGVFDRQAETARRLIDKYGETSTIRRVTPGVPTVPGKPVPPTVVNVSVRAAWLNYNLQTSGEPYVGGSLIKTGDKKVLVAALDIVDITASDLIVRADGTVYKIENPKLLDPNGQKILWALQVRI